MHWVMTALLALMAVTYVAVAVGQLRSRSVSIWRAEYTRADQPIHYWLIVGGNLVAAAIVVYWLVVIVVASAARV